MCRNNHGVAVDYFAIGVISYECMMGKVFVNVIFDQRPYQGKTRKDVRDQILAKQAQIKREEVPKDWSYNAASFINQV